MNDGTDSPGRVHAPRALDRRPILRMLCTLLWASFLGAAVSTIVLLFLPDNWSLPLSSFGTIGITFLLTWLLAMVPALVAATLAMAREPGR